MSGADNYLEFIMTAGCEITVEPVDLAFSANVRMAWTLDEFYANGGHTSFADRVAGALGIHASRMKVLSVYKGSVVVDFFVKSDTVL